MAIINDGIHITNDGQKIKISDLTDGHLLNILPKMQFSLRRFQYIKEAENRGLIETPKPNNEIPF